MVRRKIIGVVIILLALSLTMYKFNISKVNNKVEEIKQSNKVNKKQFAMYIKENGEYKEYTSSDTFPEGYIIDKNMSKCYDAEDQEIDGITFTGNDNNITVTSGKTAYCYLYFTEPTGGNSILSNLPENNGLSASTLGDMRRYQGTNAQVKNYICINDTGTKCNSGSDEMYRIIGIVEDGEEAGQIKVIKERPYGNTYKWDSNNSTVYCDGTERCSWPKNDLANNILNGTFLDKLPSKVQENIVSRQWYYGDIEDDYVSISADKMYQIETGQINTTYYSMPGIKITTEKWKKTSESVKIGLMYIHDFVYAANSHIYCCRSGMGNIDACESSWINSSQNGLSNRTDWLMTREGREQTTVGNRDSSVYAYIFHATGSLDKSYLTNSLYIRPVFYLSSEVKIKEGGTGEKTNPYILDLS